MPDFLGIGAQKCATTWVFTRLASHPEVRFPAGKELHYWDTRPDGPAAEWLAYFPTAPAGIRQGEITPAYAILGIETIRQIRRAAPGLRLFYALRNPIDRAWSSALMALTRAEMQLDEASDQWLIDHFRSAGSRQRGDYATCIANWLAVFPRESLHLIRFDDVLTAPRRTLVDLSVHIGIDATWFAQRSDAELGERVFAGPRQELRPALRAVLRDLYAEPIERLERLLGWQLRHWLA